MRLVRSAYNCGRQGSTQAHDASDALQQVIDALSEYRQAVEGSWDVLSRLWKPAKATLDRLGMTLPEALFLSPQQHVLLLCRDDMRREVPFQAETMLHDLYSLDQMVNSISSGSWAGGGGGGGSLQPPARLSAADAEEWEAHASGEGMRSFGSKAAS
jgi:hypothetical protein